MVGRFIVKGAHERQALEKPTRTNLKGKTAFSRANMEIRAALSRWSAGMNILEFLSGAGISRKVCGGETSWLAAGRSFRWVSK